MNKLEGTLNINRYMGDNKEVVIEIMDKASGCKIIEATLTPEEFGLGILGLSDRKCKIQLHDQVFIGKLRQVKTETVFFQGRNDKEAAIAAMKIFEIDGWKGREEDLFNQHRRYLVGIEHDYWKANVTFVRFVDPDTADTKNAWGIGD
jgi:hypothetical protein